ncbi:hypothetical protein [Nitrospira defluvii]|nr:hypothetical protein [Nitrospira defluvii]
MLSSERLVIHDNASRNPEWAGRFCIVTTHLARQDNMARLLLQYSTSRHDTTSCMQDQAYPNRKEPDMELVMGGLLVGVSGMLALLIVAVWKDGAAHRRETHPTHRGV